MTLFKDENDYRLAAVLVPLVIPLSSEQKRYRLATDLAALEIPLDALLILTKRADNLLHHGGQISFPGGVPEESDSNLFQTALRESTEEIGLSTELVTYVLELPQVSTQTSKFKVTPFLGLLNGLPPLKPNPEEIDKVLLIPLSHLLHPSTCVMETYEAVTPKLTLPVYYFEDNRIWGATALMIQSFLKMLHQK